MGEVFPKEMLQLVGCGFILGWLFPLLFHGQRFGITTHTLSWWHPTLMAPIVLLSLGVITWILLWYPLYDTQHWMKALVFMGIASPLMYWSFKEPDAVPAYILSTVAFYFLGITLYTIFYLNR